MVKFDNEIKLYMSAKSINESFSRITAAAFISPYNPTIDEMTEIKTAVSEAVTNAIIHGYDGDYSGEVGLFMRAKDQEIYIEVSDNGRGIPDIEKAMEPLYTSKPEMERSGMGFSVMESFMDEIKVESAPGQGTTVFMKKKLSENI